MCEFKLGDKAEFNSVGDTWTPVSIESQALQWVDPRCGSGHLYLVGHSQEHRRNHLAHSNNLRRAEQWEPCPGKHRTRNMVNEHLHRDMERLVD